MEPSVPNWADDWLIRLRVWAERDGRPLLGPGRLELLEAIDRWRSISAAARQVGMSYRHAWLLVQSVNEAAGTPLVASAVGGARGGGAQLTEMGRHAVRVFREVQQQVQVAAVQVLPRVLNPGRPGVYVHLAAAISLEEVLGRLLADYALRYPAVRVRAVFGASNELADHVLAGAPCDLFLSAHVDQIDRLRQAGRCRAEAITSLARNGLALVVPADSTSEIRRPKDLARSEAGRVAIADPASPLGRYTDEYLSRLGLRDRMADRVVIADSSRSVLAVVNAGKADVGLVYLSDAARGAGVRIVFRPKTDAAVADYRAAVLDGSEARGDSRSEARQLVDYLTSPSAVRVFRQCGFIAAARKGLGWA